MKLYLTNEADLTAVADGIRQAAGTQDSLRFPEGFTAAIRELGGRFSIRTGRVTPSSTTSTLVIPEPMAGAKAFRVSTGHDAALAAGENTIYEVRGLLAAQSDRPNMADSLYFRVNAQGGLNVAGTAPEANESGFIRLPTSKYFVADLPYDYAVYYWTE